MVSQDPQGMSELRRVARQAMLDYGLQPDFSAEALNQLGILVETDAASSDVRDLRELLWASIDNDDSRDLDQLSVAELLAQGSARVRVAIADVDSWVKAGTLIDDHARQNTTSVYTAAQIFPMLPEKLSTDLTSLVQNEERLAIVFDMTVDGQGVLSASEVYRARVLNHAKLAYDGVAAWLDGAGPVPQALAAVSGMEAQIRLQDEIAQRLKRVRTEHGALRLDTVSAQPVLDDGVLADLRPDERNRAKELIEHLMIAANGVCALFLEQHRLPSLRRILRKPERWNRIVALAAAAGGQLPSEPDSQALNEFLLARRNVDPDHFADLSLSIIKLLGAGVYGLKLPGEPIEGHFGLAVNDYTHATAPNRRFPDLVTQRLLKCALTSGGSPYSNAELMQIAEHCTRQEGNAAKVERRVRKSAAAMLLSARVGQTFEAIVTGASDKGTWVRIAHPVAEGRVMRGTEGVDVGDRIRVKLISADVVRGFIDFEALH